MATAFAPFSRRAIWFCCAGGRTKMQGTILVEIGWQLIAGAAAAGELLSEGRCCKAKCRNSSGYEELRFDGHDVSPCLGRSRCFVNHGEIFTPVTVFNR